MAKINDYSPEQIALRNERALKLAKRIGAALQNSVGEDFLPRNLDQAVVMKQRKMARNALKIFRRAIIKRKKVFYVTICHPDWICGPGELSPTIVRQVQSFVTARARRLSKHGQQRVLGFVDVAWNDRRATNEKSHWNVHAHFMVTVWVPDRYDAEKLIRDTFAVRKRSPLIAKVTYMKDLPTDRDLSRVMDYNSRCLLVHHAQKRSSFFGSKGDKLGKDFGLGGPREAELGRLHLAIGPEPFWILSGLRRDEGRVRRLKSEVPRTYAARYLRSSDRTAV